MLCEKCSNIVLRPHPYDEKYLSYHLYDTFQLLHLSAQTCHMCRHVGCKFDLYRARGAESALDSSGPICVIYSLLESEQCGERPFAFDLSKFEVCCLDPAYDPYLHFFLVEELVAIDETCFGMWADSIDILG
jgi:hypothetical protein